ncbi:MAG: HlyD family efflux transporter periplasmic adaptor subunit [Thermogutta sp.]
MATLSDSLVSSSARRLFLRKRPDLVAQRQRYEGETYWVIKDPVGLNYFRFREEEFFLLNQLDGTSSLDEVKERFEAEFPPQKITLEELQQFLGMLHRSGLVVADVPEQGYHLLQRRRERRKKELIQAFSNILAVRFKGIDPERILNALYPYVRWAFHPVTFLLCVILWISALLLVLVEFNVFLSRLPTFQQFFTPTNALWLAAVLAVTKVIHEFGHGLSCKHFGGECHEMGVMFLVLTPCLYCNVSDSWMIPSRWHRAAIGAAGIFVELTLAALATFVWWFSEPGLLNHLALNVMFICSVSTVMFNGNPLLRYDGYYVLSDLLEIPNLRQKATQILSRHAAHLFLGLEPQDDPFLPQRNHALFITYSVAAVIYRWVVVISILLFLNRLFEPYRLEIIGQAIAAASLYGLLVQPLYQLFKFLRVPGRWSQVKKPRLYMTLAGLGAVLAFIFFVPLPYHVLCTCEIQPRDGIPIYVEVPGRLDEVQVRPGDRVQAGQELARLSDSDLDYQIARLQTLANQYEVRLTSLERRRFDDPAAAAEIPSLREAYQTAKGQLAERLRDRERLVLRAAADGTVYPPPWKARRETPETTLAEWSATPMEPRNLGAYLRAGDLFCLIGDPQQMEAVLIVDQADVDFVRSGLSVRIKLDDLPSQTFRGEIAEVAKRQAEAASIRLSGKAGGEVATKTDPETGLEKPISISYQARVPLENDSGMLFPGLRGRAKIRTDPANWLTLAQRFWRILTRTFNFRL